MGFESYRVTFDLYEVANEEVRKFLVDRGFSEIGKQHIAKSIKQFEVVTPKFILGSTAFYKKQSIDKIEFEFALCNLSEIDTFFLQVITKFSQSFRCSLLISSGTPQIKEFYEYSEISEALQIIPSEIKKLRRAWQMSFGSRSRAVRVEDAYQFVGVQKWFGL